MAQGLLNLTGQIFFLLKRKADFPKKGFVPPEIEGGLDWQRTMEGNKPDIIYVSGGRMIVYRVSYKDCYRKKIVRLGTLIERRKDLRGMSRLESGLKWAKFAFGNQVKDIKRIVVVPKEVNPTGDHGTPLSGNQEVS